MPLKSTALAPVKLAPAIVTVVPGDPEVGENELITAATPVTSNEDTLAAVPDGVVTLIVPLVAPDGTDVWIWVPEMTLNTAASPLNATAVVPAKFDPVSVTIVPGVPDVGANDVTAGAGGGGGGDVTVKVVELTAVPAGVVTATDPVTAFCGTVAVIWVDETTVYEAPAPLNVTPVVPLKFVPLIVTEVPGWPDVGLKDEIDGGACGGGGAGTGSVGIIQGAGAVASPAR
jgi:hypothetical protein